MPDAVAIYARMSLDATGEGLGIARQLEDCRAEAARRGWTVADEYVDNDVSAYSGKARPAYRQMLADIEAGRIDGVLVYHFDRLQRRLRDLEEFIAACDRAGITQVASVHGDVNIGSGDGLLIVRIMAAVAENESATKSRRIKRKLLQNAQQGKPNGGGVRAFGYEPDKHTVRESEAAIIRDLAERFLAGETLRSLTRWMNDEGILTSRGNDHWHSSTVRQMLRSARISGHIEHNGEIIGPAQWPAIISPEQTDRIRATLDDPSRKKSRGPRRYLLTGLLRCSLCGHTLKSHPHKDRRRYVCKRFPETDACGKIAVTAPTVEDLIVGAVLLRLDTTELEANLAGVVADNADAAALVEQVAADQHQLDELAGLYADRKITAREWTAARKLIDARMRSASQRLHRMRNTTALDGLIGNGERLRGSWQDLNLTRQAAIVSAVLDHAAVHPAATNGGRFDIDRVKPVWRL